MKTLRRAHLRLDPLKGIYFFALAAITAAVLWVYHDIDDTFRRVHDAFITNQTDMAGEFAENIERKLVQSVPDRPEERLAESEALRNRFDETLELFSTSHYRYVYLLHYDGKRLRYLADGTKEKSERGVFGQKFDPDDEAWLEALRSGEPRTSLQKDFTGLWLTFYYPVHAWGGRDLLVFDISIEAYSAFLRLLSPINDLLKILSTLLVALLLFTMGWSVLYYFQRRKNSIDPLTHLYNRNLLLRIKNRIDLASTSVLMLDIDHFKRINDRYGHNMGDKVLFHVARVLQRITRLDDIVIRYGGEEFLVFIVGVTDRRKAIEIARRIQEAFHSQPLQTEEDTIRLTVSAGMVPNPGNVMGVEEAIQSADKMLYIAKTSGRDRLVVFAEEEERHRPVLFREIRTMIDEGRLFFCYQPIVDSATLRPVRYEMLARLRGEDRIYLPQEFIPPIRGTLAYRQLSKQLVETAIAAAEEHEVALSLNFDINDFLDETLFELLYDLLQAHPDVAKRLTVELLEENPIPDISLITEKIRRLRELGIKVALDDYGKGYAGLNYLIHFRPDLIKVDRSILFKALESPTIVAVLHTLKKTAQMLEIESVAEGVENEEMVDIVRRIGIEYMQGFHFGRPTESIPEQEKRP